ncbi:MAG: phage tail assembly chaperone, partial [Janthinobacterium lividum]
AGGGHAGAARAARAGAAGQVNARFAGAGQVSPRFADAALVAARVAGSLGWSPDMFWAATPADLRTALGLDAAAADGVGPAAMARLMEAFPDG